MRGHQDFYLDLSRSIRLRDGVNVVSRSSDVLLADLRHKKFCSLTGTDASLIDYFDGTITAEALIAHWSREESDGVRCRDYLCSFLQAYSHFFMQSPPSVIPGPRIARTTNLSADGALAGPPIAFFLVTPVCNLRCQYCFQDRILHVKGTHPPFTRLLRILDELVRNEVPFVSLSGGEPTTYPELPELLLEIQNRSLLVGDLITNGTFLSERLLDALKAVKPATVWVSLEGCDESYLDTLYGVSGSGARIKSNLQELIGADLEVGISFTLTSGGLRHLEKVRSWARDLGVRRFAAQSAKPQRGGLGHAPTVAEEVGAARLFATWANSPRPIEDRFNSSAFIIDNHSKCGALREAPVIDYDGNVMPCDWFLGESTFYLGNLLSTPLKDIWGGESHKRLEAAWYSAEQSQGCAACGSDCRAIQLRKGHGPLASMRRSIQP